MTVKIICGDSLKIMQPHGDYDALITSLPDADELLMQMPRYRSWIKSAIAKCFTQVKDTGVSICYQTDRKYRGHWFDRAAGISEVAELNNTPLLWHKIVLRQEPGTVSLYRPAYSHIFAFSKIGKVGKATPDVLPYSKSLWPNGMQINATRFAVEYAATFGTDSLIDPFCGYGTVIGFARDRFKLVLGIDIDKECCAMSRKLRL